MQVEFIMCSMGRKKKPSAAEMAKFLRQYRRKKDRNHDPNDRQYDRGLEARLKRMSAEELDRLMREETEDEGTTPAPGTG